MRVHSPNTQVFFLPLVFSGQSPPPSPHRRCVRAIVFRFPRQCGPPDARSQSSMRGDSSPLANCLGRFRARLPRLERGGNHAARHHPNRTAAAIGSCNGNLLARITSDAPGPRHRTYYQRGSSLFTTVPCVFREGDVVDATDVDSAPLPSVVPRSLRVLTAGGLRSARFKLVSCFSCRRPCPPPGQVLC